MKKQNQLGMNPSTASGRLVKDLLFKFVQDSHPNCYRCGLPMTRETFSIEHKTPWLDSSDPVGLFFDLDNIGFSHHSCNVKSARKLNKVYNSKEEARQAELKRSREYRRKTYDAAIRAARYINEGR